MVTITISEDSAEILGVILYAHANLLKERFVKYPATLAGAVRDVETIQRALEDALAE